MPLTWVYYEGPEGGFVPELHQIFSSIPDADRELRQEGLFDTLREAKFGRLSEGDLLREIETDPDVWELRLRMNGKLYRLYLAEPPGHPQLLVALHIHRKRVNIPQAQIDQEQQDAINVAVMRYRGAEHRLWTA